MADQINPSVPPSAPSASGSGLDPNVASALCYLCGIITAIVFLLIERTNKTVRFHAWHSLFFGLGTFVLYIAITILASILGQISFFLASMINIVGVLINLGLFVIWIVLMIKAYQGSRLTLPVVSELAQKQVDKEV